jgi:hypothetical protein
MSFMRRGIAFAGLAAAFGFCAWRALSHILAGAPDGPIGGVGLAAGIFTLAIAVLIRD